MSAARRHVLVLGGARSGKSAYAERLALDSGLEPVYLATGQAGDGEMAERIAAHRARRGPRWRLVEEPLELAAAIGREAGEGRALLVDCLTLWLANLMEAGRPAGRAGEELAAALGAARGPVVLVANELGLGTVSGHALTRRFRDAHGLLNQRVAEAVGRVVLVVAGLPVLLKPATHPELAL